MNHIVPELLVAGAVVGALLGLSGLARTIGRAAAAVAALAAIWVIVMHGPYVLMDHARSLVETVSPYVDLIIGLGGGLLISAVIDRERKRSRQS